MTELIDFIEENLKKDRLESIASSVISAYKSGDAIRLKTYAEALDIGALDDSKRMFYSLIGKLHPDRFSVIYDDFKKAAAKNDETRLLKIKQILDVKKNAKAAHEARFEYQHTETWAEPAACNFDEDHDAEAEVFENFSGDEGFLGAVKDVIFGNHDFHIEPADLAQIDGGLDIAFRELDDIEGIEYCRNVRILNISGNRISNIYDLQELTQLEELYASDNLIREIDSLENLEYLEIVDFSDNDIEDFSPLLNMGSLKFADLRNNPVQNSSIIRKLQNSGVIVLY